MKARSFGTKRVMPVASWRNSTADSFVPLDDETCMDDNKSSVKVAFVALSAVVMLPGGVNTPSMTLINRFFHIVALMTVIF